MGGIMQLIRSFSLIFLGIFFLQSVGFSQKYSDKNRNILIRTCKDYGTKRNYPYPKDLSITFHEGQKVYILVGFKKQFLKNNFGKVINIGVYWNKKIEYIGKKPLLTYGGSSWFENNSLDLRRGLNLLSEPVADIVYFVFEEKTNEPYSNVSFRGKWKIEVMIKIDKGKWLDDQNKPYNQQKLNSDYLLENYNHKFFPNIFVK